MYCRNKYCYKRDTSNMVIIRYIYCRPSYRGESKFLIVKKGKNGHDLTIKIVHDIIYTN